MKNKRGVAFALAALLLLALVVQTAALAVTIQTPVINRSIARNEARSLDAMPEAARARTDTLVIGVPDLMGETNPFFVETAGDDSVASLLYDELVFRDNSGGAGAGVATFAVSADGRTYTFTIKENVKYADGVAVTSDDFINALYLLLMPGYSGAYDIARLGISGAEAYQRGESAQVSGIARVSERAFSVTTDVQNPQALLYLAIPALRVSVFGDMRRPGEVATREDFTAFCRAALESVRAADATGMTYGQYTLTQAEPGVRAVFAKNAGYWRGEPKIGTVELLVVPSESKKAFAAIESGLVDIISLMGTTDIVASAFELGFINLYTWEGDVLGYLGMDLENALFSDASVRQALAIGFDRDHARADAMERYALLPNVVLFDSFGSDASSGELYPYDAERATQLLEDAGWVKGEDGLLHRAGKTFAFTLTYNTQNPVMDSIVRWMQEGYQALGIDMQVETVPLEELTERIERGTCDMYFRARRLPPSAALAADLFVGDSYRNESGYDDAALERFLRLAAAETDPARQSVYYEVLFQELYAELPFIPLYRRSEMLLVNARVMNAAVTTAHNITAEVYRFFLVDTLEGQW